MNHPFLFFILKLRMTKNYLEIFWLSNHDKSHLMIPLYSIFLTWPNPNQDVNSVSNLQATSSFKSNNFECVDNKYDIIFIRIRCAPIVPKFINILQPTIGTKVIHANPSRPSLFKLRRTRTLPLYSYTPPPIMTFILFVMCHLNNQWNVWENTRLSAAFIVGSWSVMMVTGWTPVPVHS